MLRSKTYQWWYDAEAMSPNEAMAELEWFAGEFGIDVEYDVHEPYVLIYDVPVAFMEDLVHECGGEYRGDV